MCSKISPHRVIEIPTHQRKARDSPNSTLPRKADEIKFEAVVVTVAAADEEENLNALAKNVHIAALHRNTSPIQQRRRSRWIQSQSSARSPVYAPHISLRWSAPSASLAEHADSAPRRPATALHPQQDHMEPCRPPASWNTGWRRRAHYSHVTAGAM